MYAWAGGKRSSGASGGSTLYAVHLYGSALTL
jgi:hypothetical protein